MPKVLLRFLLSVGAQRNALVFLLLIWCSHASAQDIMSHVHPDSIPSIPDVTLDIHKLSEQVKENSKPAPLALRSVSLAAIGAGAWVATYAYVDEPLQQFSQSNRSDFTKAVARVVEPMGRQKYMMPAAGLAFASGLVLQDSKLQKVGLLSAGSLLVNAFASGTLKKTFHRYRPSITTENHVYGAVESGGCTSLPSSHTSTAFTVATSVALVYGKEYKFVPPVAYSIATLVGLSRIHDNKHWATDVMAGALVGYLSAKATNYVYDFANQKWQAHKYKLHLNPQVSSGSGGLVATLVF